MSESIHEQLEQEAKASRAAKKAQVEESHAARANGLDTPEDRRGRRYSYLGKMLAAPRNALGRFASPRHTADGKWKTP